MRISPKSAFALASVLTLSLAACAGDEGDVTGDDADDEASRNGSRRASPATRGARSRLLATVSMPRLRSSAVTRPGRSPQSMN